MAQTPGILLPKELANLAAQRTRTWDNHDDAARSANQLERLAAKVPDGAGPALQALSSNGQPPDELAAAVESLIREVKTTDQLRKDLEAAERSRFNMIVTLVIVGVVLFLLLVLFAVCVLGGLLKK
jgi:hypothetical protein